MATQSMVNENPAGTSNGKNTVFTLANQPVGSIAVYVGGLRYTPGHDYTITGKKITLNVAPSNGMLVTVDYQYNK